MKNYELMYIIASEVSEDDKAATVAYVETALKNINAENVVVEKIGEKKLAYPIDKKFTGYYVLVKFSAEGEKLEEVEKKINLNEKVIRFILVKKEK